MGIGDFFSKKAGELDEKVYNSLGELKDKKWVPGTCDEKKNKALRERRKSKFSGNEQHKVGQFNKQPGGLSQKLKPYKDKAKKLFKKIWNKFKSIIGNKLKSLAEDGIYEIISQALLAYAGIYLEPKWIKQGVEALIQFLRSFFKDKDILEAMGEAFWGFNKEILDEVKSIPKNSISDLVSDIKNSSSDFIGYAISGNSYSGSAPGADDEVDFSKY